MAVPSERTPLVPQVYLYVTDIRAYLVSIILFFIIFNPFFGKAWAFFCDYAAAYATFRCL